MNILFDVEVVNPDIWETASTEELVILTEMLDFVKNRLIVLKDEMDDEELSTPISKGVLIELKRKRISCVNYSDELENKILGSFSESDIQYMLLKIEGTLSNLLN